VIKFTNSSSAKIVINGSVDCLTGLTPGDLHEPVRYFRRREHWQWHSDELSRRFGDHNTARAA